MAKRKSTKGQTTEIEEKQTTRNWPKEKGQKDKQPSTKHTYKTKDWVTRTPLTQWPKEKVQKDKQRSTKLTQWP